MTEVLVIVGGSLIAAVMLLLWRRRDGTKGGIRRELRHLGRDRRARQARADDVWASGDGGYNVPNSAGNEFGTP